MMKSKNKDWLGVEKCIKIGAKGFSFSFPIENMMLQLYKFVRESCSLVMVPSKNLSHPVFHILLSTSLNILIVRVPRKKKHAILPTEKTS